MNKTGTVFDIARFSLNDGPGIRTTVFLKGCPLRCQWCHNPESILLKPQLAFFSDKCTGCEKCRVCNVHNFESGHYIDFSSCTACGKCVSLCPANALKIYGYSASAEEIMDVVLRDVAYYSSSGGGLTISGGEPMFQPGFTLEILKKAKEHNIHTAVETSGFAKVIHFEAVLPYTDLFLYDYKAGPDSHKELTSVDRGLIDSNLDYLLKNNASVVLRCPVIPQVNENESVLNEYIKNHPKLLSVEYLPYHNMGEYKRYSLKM